MGLYIDIKRKLSGFSLQVNLTCEQDIIGILGASGSGKSMLLNCVAGLVRPDEGKIILDDKTLFDSEKNINLPSKDRKIGFLFQHYALFPHMTISENIAFGLGKLSRQDKHKKIIELMERFNLEGIDKRYPGQISGGQQQRVALARALAVEPEILILDEPFSALDNHLKNHMMKEMLVSLKEFDGTALFVTHNIEEAYRLCKFIAVLNNGRVEMIGPKQEVFEKPASYEAAKITGCKNISPAARKSEHIIEVPRWGINVITEMNIQKEKGYAGIRANYIQLATGNVSENTFPVWIADESEAPFRTTLYLKIGSEPRGLDDFHIQWETGKDQRNLVRQSAQPFNIYLPPEKVFFTPN